MPRERARGLQSDTVQAPDFIPQSHWDRLMLNLNLSRREQQILRLFIANQTDANIASALNISTHTVQTYSERLYRKMNAKNRTDVVVRLFAAYAALSVESP
jgi:DNA-binding NarL/FixJ family response regulator